MSTLCCGISQAKVTFWPLLSDNNTDVYLLLLIRVVFVICFLSWQVTHLFMRVTLEQAHLPSFKLLFISLQKIEAHIVTGNNGACLCEYHFISHLLLLTLNSMSSVFRIEC